MWILFHPHPSAMEISPSSICECSPFNLYRSYKANEMGYSYRQNPTVRQSVDDSGKLTTINTQRTAKVLTIMVSNDVETVPDQPSADCPDVTKLEKALQDTISVIRDLFEQRPAWTRRALKNTLKTYTQRTQLRHAIPYVAYIFRSGPWRDAIVRFGYDPRQTADSRAYQTLMFKMLPREPDIARDAGGGKRNILPRSEAFSSNSNSNTDDDQTHLFTGHSPLARDGKIWMLCDITDPQLSRVLFPERYNNDVNLNEFLRPTCDIYTDGWYDMATLAKIRTVMRAKIQSMLEDKEPDPTDFTTILAMPDHIDSSDTELPDFTLDPATYGPKQSQLATELRATIRGSAGYRNRVGGNNKKGAGGGGGSSKGKSKANPANSTRSRRNAVDGAADDESDGGADDDVDDDVVMDMESEGEGEEEAIERADMLEAKINAAGTGDIKMT